MFTRFTWLAAIMALATTMLCAQGLTPVTAGQTTSPDRIFQPLSRKAAPDLPKSLGEYTVLQTDEEAYSQLMAAAGSELTLSIPAADAELKLELRPNHFFSSDFRLTTESGETLTAADLGKHYLGAVAGEPGSQVALSLTEAGMKATVIRADGKRLSLAPLSDQSKSKVGTHTYVLFSDAAAYQDHNFDCGTVDNGIGYTAKQLAEGEGAKNAGAGCVDVYFEIDYDIFQDKGGSRNAASYLASVFNEVNALYATIGVDLHVSEIFVWDRSSPYSGNSSGVFLQQFQKTRTSFNGDIAQLISYKGSGGIAILDGLCHPYNSARMSYSSIRSSYSQVPTFSWSVMVIAHELGHLLGSQHTHACVWNGNNTAIDGCAGSTEGNCGNPGIPSGGGTIMSYCHITRAGIDFRNGFGKQPGAVIAGRVASSQKCVQASCTVSDGGSNPPVTGDDGGGSTGGGGNGPECAYLELTLDNFGPETKWTVTEEASGDVVLRGGPYDKKQAGTKMRDTLCLPAGCYLYTITDSHGDGICCDYGQGSFKLTDGAGTVFGNGSNFGNKKIIDFCLGEVDGGGGGGEGDDCPTLAFRDRDVIPFGGSQDRGVLKINNGGRELRIANNAWKAIDTLYDITSNTVLSFYFRSTRQGEVHGIGFDDNLSISSSLTFRLYGTQSYGIPDFDDYPGDGEWKYYSIPVGKYYTGRSAYLVFVADHDAGDRNGISEFRDVLITESAPCNAPANLPGTNDLPAVGQLEVYPNPARLSVNVDLPAAGDYEVLDLDGRQLMNGSNGPGQLTLDVSRLPAGAYLMRYTGGGTSLTRRFVVSR